MSVLNLDRLFQPRHVAVIGASDVAGKVGHTALHNLIAHGFPGEIYAVNVNRDRVQGLRCYPSLAALPCAPDLVVICTPAATVPAIVESCGERGVAGVIILTAGFGESGVEGRRLEAELRQVHARYPAVRLIGPNCLGAIVTASQLNASFAAGMPAPGHLAMLSQSGALCTAILDWAANEQIGFSYFLSLGNMLDVGIADVLEYLAEDPGTDSVVVYIESITQARAFMSAARRFARRKPIVAYKAGRFQESAKAASSHTGALAGADDVFEAAFRRAGIVRVYDMGDMFGCAELLARARRPRGPHLGIITNAGGPGVMACDALLAARGELAELSPDSRDGLNAVLPPYWSHNNPVDVLGDATATRFAAATRILLDDPGVDAVLAILTPQAMTDATATARAVAKEAVRTEKPVLAAWMGGGSVAEGIDALNSMAIPTYKIPERAIQAFEHLVEYARRRDLSLDSPREAELSFSPSPAELRSQVEAILASSEGLLDEGQSKALLSLYGIPISRTIAAHGPDDAVRLAHELGYPVVLKIHSPQITHKSDVGGVRLNLASEDEVRRAFDEIVERAQRLRPEAEILGVTVQPMIHAADGVGLIVGTKRDPIFGPVILVGAGGVTAEIMGDRSLELPPLNGRLARQMLTSLRCWPLLDGFRGRPKVDVSRVVDVLLRFSRLIEDTPEIREADINPLLALPDACVAVDARFYVDGLSADHARPAPYAHLAIAPGVP